MRARRFKFVRSAAVGLLLFTFGFVVFSIFYKFKETVFIIGKVVSTSPSVFLNSGTSGRIQEILVSTNDPVSANQTLITIDCSSNVRSKEQARDRTGYLESAIILAKENSLNQLQSSEISIEKLEEYILIYKGIASNGAVSQLAIKDYENQLALEQLRKQRMISENSRRLLDLRSELSKSTRALEIAEEAIESCTIKSPINGIVSEISINPEQLISKNTPVIKIFNPSKQSFVFTLKPSDLPYINMNNDFDIRVNAYPFERYGSISGKIVSISPLTSDLINDNSGATQQLSAQDRVNAFLAKANITKSFVRQNGLPLPVLRDGMPAIGLFKSTDKRLVYILSDQFVKIQNSIASMRSRF